MVYSIYGLVDPEDPELVRYVGATHRPISQRIAEHVRDAKTGRPSPVNRWVAYLLALGRRPCYVVLGAASEDWQEVEAFYIATTPNVLNVTVGGAGHPKHRR